MKILKAFYNLSVDTIFDKSLDKQKKVAKKNAYIQTGDEIRKAKKAGYHINGSARYRQNAKNNLTTAEDKNNKWRNFTKDLFD